MSGRHLEAFTGQEFEKFLRDEGYQLVRQTGSHRYWAKPGSNITLGSIDNDHMTCHLMRRNAELLDISYKELRAAMGRPVQTSSKPKKAMAREPRPSSSNATKGQTLRLLAEIQEGAKEIAASIQNGQRDPSVYQRIFTECSSARLSLSKVKERV